MHYTRKKLTLMILSFLLVANGLFSKYKTIPNTEGPSSVILITEIMFDPDPAIALPKREYIELYNSSSSLVNLQGWHFSAGEKRVELPGYQLEPKSYVLVIQEDWTDEFSSLNVDILPVEKWLTLRNTGQFLSITNADIGSCHFVEYHPSQIEDQLKKEGGWSLELTDFYNPCSTEAWKESLDPMGGTPGRKNSRSEFLPDGSAPRLKRVGVPDQNKIIIHLTEAVFPIYTDDWLSFEFNISTPRILEWKYNDLLPNNIELTFDGNLPEEEIIEVKVKGKAEDCSGNLFKPGKLLFGLPQNPEPGDIRITEVMFNPDETGCEFVEIFNYSDKIIALNELYLAVYNSDSVLKKFSKPDESSFIMLPGEYYILCDSEANIIESYNPEAYKISVRNDFPSLTNEKSGLALLNLDQSLLEWVKYDPESLNYYESAAKGLSLERIDINTNGADPSNWHPASYTSGGASPGLPNTQRTDIGAKGDKLFSIAENSFSPNHDGIRDYFLVRCTLPGPGWYGQAQVWGLDGALIAEISPPGFLPVDGLIKWDGMDSEGNIVLPGFYVLIINYENPDGRKGRWKEVAVVMGN